MRIEFPGISPPVILACIIDNKALCISDFKLCVGTDSLIQGTEQHMEQCDEAKTLWITVVSAYTQLKQQRICRCLRITGDTKSNCTVCVSVS